MMNDNEDPAVEPNPGAQPAEVPVQIPAEVPVLIPAEVPVLIPVEVSPLIRHAQYYGRTAESCSLFGCSQVVSEAGNRYCSLTHQTMAGELTSLGQAFVVVDGFFGEFKDKDIRSVVCLLKRYEQGIDVGIPLIEDPSIFKTFPWDWNFINLQMLEQETSRSWLYFHSLTNPPLGYFDFFGAQVSWTSKNYYLHEYQRNEEIVEVVSVVTYLRQNPTDPLEGVDEWLRGWCLTEYVYNHHSLFCLSHSNTLPSLFKTNRFTLKDRPEHKEKIDRKRKRKDDPSLKKSQK